MIRLDEQFPAAYEAECLDEWPSAGFDVEFIVPGGSSRASAVVVRPDDGPRWSASVAGHADALRDSVSGLFATPSPDTLCVIERGTAFLVDVHDPARYRQVPLEGSVSAVIPVRGHHLLLLVTPWSITAVGERDVAWTSGRVAIEGLRVDEIDEGWLRGVADPESDEPRDVAVDLATGHVVGGAGL